MSINITVSAYEEAAARLGCSKETVFSTTSTLLFIGLFTYHLLH